MKKQKTETDNLRRLIIQSHFMTAGYVWLATLIIIVPIVFIIKLYFVAVSSVAMLMLSHYYKAK